MLLRQLSLLQAYERRFPVCPLVPQLLATDVLREEKSDDGAHHTVERRCTIDFEVPYILRKVLIALLHTPTCSNTRSTPQITGQEVMYFIQRNELDWRARTLDIYTHNETFSSRIVIKEHCKYYVRCCWQPQTILPLSLFYTLPRYTHESPSGHALTSQPVWK